MPNVTVFAQDMNNSAGQDFILTQMNNLYYLNQWDVAAPPVPRKCLQSYVAFWCADYYPQCSDTATGRAGFIFIKRIFANAFQIALKTKHVLLPAMN